MDLTALETTEIISLYGSVIKELKARGVIRTNNPLGDLGEYLAIDSRSAHFGCRPYQHRKH